MHHPARILVTEIGKLWGPTLITTMSRILFKFESSRAIEFLLRSLMYHPNGCFALIKASCSSILFSLMPPQEGKINVGKTEKSKKTGAYPFRNLQPWRGRRDAAARVRGNEFQIHANYF